MPVRINWEKYPKLFRLQEDPSYAPELRALVYDIIDQARRMGVVDAREYVAAYALPPSRLTPKEIALWRDGFLQTLAEMQDEPQSRFDLALADNDPKLLRIKKAAREGYIDMADNCRVSQLRAEVDRVLRALGHPEALVTDESRVSDFRDTPNELTAVSARLGVPVEKQDLICNVALRVAQRSST